MNFEFKINGKTLETERLILRPFNENDLDDFFEYAMVEGVGEMAGWNHHQNKEESKRILDMFISEDKTFAIVLKENKKVIGSLGVEKYNTSELKELDDYFGREIGFVLSKDYWGKGIMAEAVKEVIKYLFDNIKLDFLICCYYSFNNQSKRVQEKCGFRKVKEAELKTTLGTIEKTTINILYNPKKDINII